jgi:sec-independent protein translocase protein TatA
MGRIGPGELFFILLIVIVLFGSTKIPQLGKGLGEGIRNFRKGLRGDDDESDASSRSDSAQNPR